MNVPSTNLANTSIASFQQLSAPLVGQETAEAKAQALPPVEEAPQGARLLNRRDPGDKTAQNEEQLRLRDNAQNPNEQTDALDPDARRQNSDQQESAANDRQQAAVEQQETQEIAALAARDREVRAHEAAHAAVGGQYAGSPSYTFRRGPDGVNYAVGGEVSISTGGVPGDPEATLRKAQQVQRAALAPADPSSQDRRVAARAAQLAQQARVEISAQAAAEARATAETAANRGEDGNDSDATTSDASAATGTRPLKTDTIDPQQASGLATPAVDPQQISGLASEAQEISGLASPAIVNVEGLLSGMGLRESIHIGAIVDQVV